MWVDSNRVMTANENSSFGLCQTASFSPQRDVGTKSALANRLSLHPTKYTFQREHPRASRFTRHRSCYRCRHSTNGMLGIGYAPMYPVLSVTTDADRKVPSAF
jgi:hypothetical protein